MKVKFHPIQTVYNFISPDDDDDDDYDDKRMTRNISYKISRALLLHAAIYVYR